MGSASRPPAGNRGLWDEAAATFRAAAARCDADYPDWTSRVTKRIERVERLASDTDVSPLDPKADYTT